MIRAAEERDREQVLEMGLRFLRESPYHGFLALNPDAMARTFDGVMTSADGAVLVADSGGELKGMLLMVAYEHPLSGERMASELAWWVNPEARSGGSGVKLLRAAEGWAANAGAVAVQMIAPTADVERLYERMQYRKMETFYQRKV